VGGGGWQDGNKKGKCMDELSHSHTLARAAFTSLTVCMDCHCVLEKQPGKADN